MSAPRHSHREIVGALICAFFLPIVGIVWGIVLLARERIGQGLAVLAMSILATGIGLAIYLAVPSTKGSSSTKGATAAPTETAAQYVEAQEELIDVKCTSENNNEWECVGATPTSHERVYYSVTLTEGTYEAGVG